MPGIRLAAACFHDHVVFGLWVARGGCVSGFVEQFARAALTRSQRFPVDRHATLATATAKMGDDPAQSVLNRFNQMHDADNVFVVDGGVVHDVGGACAIRC